MFILAYSKILAAIGDIGEITAVFIRFNFYKDIPSTKCFLDSGSKWLNAAVLSFVIARDKTVFPHTVCSYMTQSINTPSD